LRRKHDRQRFGQLERFDYVLSRFLVDEKMRRLEMRRIGGDVGIDLKHDDTRRIVFVAYSIKRQHARLEADRFLDLLSQRSLINLGSRRIDLDLGDAHVRLPRTHFRYCSSLTFSIQSTTLPPSAS